MGSGHSPNIGADWTKDNVFNAAWAYDLAFAWDIDSEVERLIAIAGLGGNGHVLIPACGTGRFARALAERGFSVEASDINPEMLRFAERRRSHPKIRYSIADMSRSLGDTDDCDAIFTVCNSFRYVLEDAAALGHLRAVRNRLRPGCVYVTELALNDADVVQVGEGCRWSIDHGDLRAAACWTVTALTPPTSMERAEIRVESPGGVVHHVSADQPQRLWTWDALVRAAGASGLEAAGACHVDGTRAINPNLPDRYYVILKRPAETASS